MNKIFNFLKRLKQFDLAAIKLSVFYILIVMIISISFSVSIYKISSLEIYDGIGRQYTMIRDLPVEKLPKHMINLEILRQQQVEESNDKLKTNLIYFNALILLISSLTSYFLARKTLRPIEESMELQNRFTADASHELRTPLTAMKTEIEVSLRDKNLNITDVKELLKSNLEEITKLENLSNALLKLAKNESHKEDFTIVDLEDIIISSYEKVQKLAENKSITFETDLESISIPGDKESLTELFIILLDNAIKYSPEKSTIKIQTKTEGNHTKITIKDQGSGIKASDLPYIFNRFYRADNSRNKGKIDGFGLGLSIAKQIVELHNGTILVSSKPGKGSEFIVIL